MATINLLPWREERRELIKQQFLVVLGGVAVLGALLILLAMSIVNSAISGQEARNNYMQAQITKINKEVAEISELEKRRQQLLDRMTIIQDLQGTRPLIVRVFDEMVRTLPDGLFYTSVVRRDKQVNVEGIAESNNRVSSLMRKLDGSPWFADPNLTAVSAASAYGDQASSFKLSFQISAPAPDDEK
ncbi:MAG: type IV pilus assembly protein PilN [Zhongshania aliphaticivorans]|mgnify:CR=1 FL=1|jgi:type IV pilus assembly protein PilN|uniref:Pilus assembly protein PilN n=1 Tax=Zhongshania aliphaticivorans TaxID=1470434 RepID=A0A127M2W2_9GAMM|nr:PilN domain-containing protein [Zhongshania aliphaticivorans]AMO67560.1 pilus assembly protein PilN [Zhongshania aliphaticivorans]EIF45011.1 type 4 fimbrial biogenesis protein PilN [gamma proteobacterium BDW918]|tara:strand:- start:114202 stop:114762 length:561 start_codon:yes stop_codon:yes gene_type:complete